MDCNQAQDRLLNADSIEHVVTDPELTAHLQSCPACQAMLADLGRLEAAARALPPAPDSELTKQTFLALLAPEQSTAGQSRWHHRVLSFRRTLALSGRRLAMAASVVLATGLIFWAVWFQGVQKAAAADALVDHLVDWDVQLAAAESPDDRQKIYADLAPSLEKSVNKLTGNTTNQLLAHKLLETGTLLSKSVDPADDAEQIADVADLLLDQMAAATNANQTAHADRLAQYYAKVSEGLAGSISRAHGAATNPAHPANQPRPQHVVRPENTFKARVNRLLAESPGRTREQIRKELLRARHARLHPGAGKSHDTPTTDESPED